MRKTIHQRRQARQDMVDIYRYHAHEAGISVAERFYAQAEATFRRLADMPGMGTRFEHDHPALAEVRYFPVSRFRNHIVFYRFDDDGLYIVRVLHGARDIHGILAEEFGIGDEADGDEAAKEQ